MGQPIAVTEKPTIRPGIVRFETNRSFTGMGHEHYHSLADATGPRPPDEIARRLLATGKVDGVHVYMNVITVDVKKGHDASGLSGVIEGLYTYWQPGMVPPDFEDVAADEPAAGATAASSDAPADDAMSEAAKRVPCRVARTQSPGAARKPKRRPPRASASCRRRVRQAVVTRSAHARRGTSDHKPLELVVLARLVEEHVHDEVSVVEQHPLEVVEPLDTNRARASVALQLFLDGVHDRAHLPRVRTARDDEVVRDRQHRADREDDGIIGLLRRGSLRGEFGPALDRALAHALSQWNRSP